MARRLLLDHLILTGKLHNYLVDLNEQAQERYRFLIQQMAAIERAAENLKRRSQWEQIRGMNNIVSRGNYSIVSS